MKRMTVSIATLLLVLFAGSSCSDYSGGNGIYAPPPPPDTTFADGLWTAAGVSPAVLRFESSQLEATASVAATTTITTNSASLANFNGVAFDADGTLWVTSAIDARLIAFERPALATSGARAASRVITSSNGSLTAPVAIAFDAAHGLWVANADNGTIVRFDSTQLANGGAPTPTIVLSGVGHPTGLAFDADGGLWFSDGGAHRVAKYSAAQLGASGFILPQVVLTSNGPDIGNPIGLAFDAAGTLWIANSGQSNVIAITEDHLSTTALVHADIVISPSFTYPTLPLGLTFDEHGNLWVSYGEGILVRYDHASLAASGTPAPAVIATIKDHTEIRSAAFWPTPAGLPLQ